MTPAERARHIDKQEFAAECKAARERAVAYATRCRKREKEKVKAWLSGAEPAPINLAAMTIARQPVTHCVNGECRTMDGWAKHLGISKHALIIRRRKLGSLEAAIAMGFGSQRGRQPSLIEFNGEALTIKEWALRLGIKEDSLRHRMHTGRTAKEAIALGGPLRRPDPGVASNFAHSEGTGAGSTAQETPKITFSEDA
ncbi:hypothetical protein B5K11_10455 [Rhizobium leguminosarum bv. trifolii]|uniref:hypothetical protein n=1 Tax=Rhizobium leguminosarum TaxID=384 RepID=UPI000E2F0177|nr:hypothetical protein [Rhizobium leguminosarum]RFB95346.1 hypothetical protein B5K11_10455 [Rhizobium leguminosarum bv. trifolii]